jgi:hypothetical protein
MKADINNREELNKLLDALTENATGAWGVMKVQNMIEHFAIIIEHSNGKRPMNKELLMKKLMR